MKKIISTALAVVMLISALPATAATWITLSSWAYNDVSNFKKEGLVPESLDDIDNYTVDINRLQFAEILYEALAHSSLVTRTGYTYGFEDVKSAAATCLKSNRIITGEIISTDEYGNHSYNFNPDRTLTREEMAVMLYRTAQSFAGGLLQAESVVPNDNGEVSDYAKDAVGAVMGCGVMSGTGGGNFSPKETLTIEQAVSAVYRLYQRLPSAPNTDGAGINAENETLIKTYSNGMTETKKGNVLYLKDGDSVVMEFETDIYSRVDAVTVDNRSYAVAQHVNKKTDVYDTETKKIVFSIPHTFSSADEDYIVTTSSDIGPMTFGLYDYSGREILEPKYSTEEVEGLKANGFVPKTEEYRAPDGWFYYADWDDDGHMYRIDSNGENKQKLSDNDCYNIEYMNGWLYYSIRGEDEDKLYCMRADGKYEQRLTDKLAALMEKDDSEVVLSEEFGVNFSGMATSDYIFDDEWVYYAEGSDDYKIKDGEIWRVKMTDDGKPIKEKVSEGVTLSGGKYVMRGDWRNGALYFISDNTLYNDNGDVEYRPDSLYRFKDGELKKLSGDADVNNYGFTDDGRLVYCEREKYKNEEYGCSYLAAMNIYICDENDENPVIWEDARKYVDISIANSRKSYDKYIEAAENGTELDLEKIAKLPEPEETVNETMSDDKFTVYYITEYEWLNEEHTSYGGSRASLWVRDSGGNRAKVCDNEWIGGFERSGDVLYYPRTNYHDGHSGNAIMAYDMNTGVQTMIADDVLSLGYDGDDWLFYTDVSHNTHRYDLTDGTDATVAPNNNSRRYGELYYISRDGNLGKGGTYKVDVDGNISLITDDYAMYATYVPNGANHGNSGYKYDMDEFRAGKAEN